MTTITVEQRGSRHSAAQPDPGELDFQRLKVAIHELLVESLNLSVVDIANEQDFAGELRVLAQELC